MKTIYRDPSCRHVMPTEDEMDLWFARQEVINAKVKVHNTIITELMQRRMVMLQELGTIWKRAESIKKATKGGQELLI